MTTRMTNTVQAVYILWLRQLKRYFRSPARIIGSLGQPVLFLLALGFGLSPVFERAGAGSYMDFLIPGVIGMSILFTAVFSGVEIIWDRQFGFLKETLVAPVSREMIMVGRTLGGATVALIQGGIVLLLSLFFGFRPELASLPLTFLFMVLIALLFTALGTAIGSFLEDMQGFQLIMNFILMPIFFLSGALFPLEGLPKALEIVTRIDPLSYGIDGLRSTLLSTPGMGIALDIAVLAALTGIFIGLGGYLFSRIQI